MLSLAPYKGDIRDTPEERRVLYEPTARAIAAAASETSFPMRAAAVLIALGHNETMFGRYVLEGRCMDGPPGMRCDYSERQKRPLAIGPFQVRDWCRGAWQATAGSYDSVLASARCALEYINRGLKRCAKPGQDAWAGSFATYRGQRCADAAKVGGNYRAMKYLKSMVRAERQLKLESAEQSREFLEFLKKEYGAPLEVADNT